MNIEQLKTAINAVVEYDWQKELKDYRECEAENENSREGHIFNTLVALHNFITGETFGADYYLTDYPHVYSIRRCSNCDCDLTKEGNVEIEASINGSHVGRFKTRLNEDGVLMPDEEGMLARGAHTGSLCLVCRTPFDSEEILG